MNIFYQHKGDNFLNQLTIKVFALFVLASLSFTANAQFDTKLWFPPVWNANQPNLNARSEFLITTKFPVANVRVYTVDGAVDQNFVVRPGQPANMALSPTLGMTLNLNQVENSKGLIVESDYPVQVTYRLAAVNNQNIVTLKGKQALGTLFYAGSQTINMDRQYARGKEHHFISVMATEDNTIVTFELPASYPYNFAGLGTKNHSVTLNEGETYLVRGEGPLQQVTGTKVSTNGKNIVVNSGSEHTRIEGPGASSAEGGADQLVPIERIGNEYIVMRGENDPEFEYSIIVATEDNTQIFIDGAATPVTTLNEGEYYNFMLGGPYTDVGRGHYITSNNPIYVYQVSGSDPGRVRDEVGMAIVPPLFCAGSKYIEFVPFKNYSQKQRINIVLPQEGLSSLTFNGQSYTSYTGVSVYPVNGRPDYYAVSFPTQHVRSQDNLIITSDEFLQVGYMTGASGTGTYGFLSGFGSKIETVDPYHYNNTGEKDYTSIYDFDSDLATPGYQGVVQGSTVDMCIWGESCAPPNLVNDVRTSGKGEEVQFTPATDSCFTYTASKTYYGKDTVEVQIINEIGAVETVFIIVDVISALDLAIDENSINYNAPTCPETDFTVSFDITNLSDIPFNDNLDITFYDGDPTGSGARRLNTISVPINNLNENDVFTVNDAQVEGTGEAIVDLYIAINDNGTSGIPINFPSTIILETDYTNNIGAQPVPALPFPLEAEKLKDNINCDPAYPDNGAARANVIINGNVQTTGYSYRWFDGPTPVTGNADFTQRTYPNLAEGTYSVFAINDRFGCQSDTVEVEIGVQAEFFSADIEEISPLTNCVSPNGALRATVPTADDDDFDFYWYNDEFVQDNTTLVGVGQLLENIDESDYTVKVINKNTGCFEITSASVSDQRVIPNLNLDSEPQTVCNPANGRVIGGIDQNPLDYDFTWTNEESTLISNNQNVDQLEAGMYYLSVVNPNTLCSDMDSVEVEDNTPEMDIIPQNNGLGDCFATPLTATATFSSNGYPVVDAEFNWYFGNDIPPTDGLFATGDEIENVPPGDYVIEAIDPASGCSDYRPYTVDVNAIVPEINANPFSSDQCVPFNGRIIGNVTNMPSDKEHTDYVFYVFEGTNRKIIEEADFEFVGNATGPGMEALGLEPGDYTIVAKQSFGFECESEPYTVPVDDDADYPNSIDESILNANCLNAEGRITLTSNQPYNFQWFSGDIENDETVNDLNLTDNNTTQSQLNNQPSGYYSAIVTNPNNLCQDSVVTFIDIPTLDEYVLRTNKHDDPFCFVDSGRVSVSLVNTEFNYPFEFTYRLERIDESGNSIVIPYTGDPTNQTYLYRQLAPSDYRVSLIQLDENGNPAYNCKSEEVVVDNLEENPEIIAEATSPLTVCSPRDPNGQAEVRVTNGDIFTHSFEWTIKDEQGNQTLVARGSEVYNLLDSTYTVTATNNLNYCQNTTTVTIEDARVYPTVIPELIKGRENCIEPDGIQNAYVPGVDDQDDYQFEWYDLVDGSDELDTLDHYYTGQTYDMFNIGDYTVVSINRATSCRSEAVYAFVPDERVYPEFYTRAKPAECDYSNGFARAVVTNDVDVESILWDMGGVYSFGSDLINIPTGLYEVKVTTVFGCADSTDVTIEPDIFVYNGVSANEDGKNDHFIVDCIECFENNNVKIFNRYGDLVYETDGYTNDYDPEAQCQSANDSLGNNFRGNGNRGIYAGGKKLPIGTYFYVIDKGDGSEPKNGYLELVR
ncbi:gliding motility-associated C-terminal domain-containing protein [Mangrovivirga sp. M17]|uniref:Gliding motility-associated C-terminal domain-containing protein n=1 Tax=Mangrovivirga halotolerans TaxID=2993936 RepID=A0ABT3RL43_9BACT|nr:gliding motility-associated C-terminal domain-containing protein [Mangrovivirga halotolerans]MCX2742275.1 gliding motility-associated C-terminal domain-containing protein [Mangrovivirga halotolerans]